LKLTDVGGRLVVADVGGTLEGSTGRVVEEWGQIEKEESCEAYQQNYREDCG